MKTIHSTGMVYWYHRYRTYLLNICITTQIQYLIYYQYCCKKLLHNRYRYRYHTANNTGKN